MALTWQLFCIEIANGIGIGIGTGTGTGTGVAPGHECRRSYLRNLLDAFRIFHFINSPIDRLIVNRKQKREQQQHKSETRKEGKRRKGNA